MIDSASRSVKMEKIGDTNTVMPELSGQTILPKKADREIETVVKGLQYSLGTGTYQWGVYTNDDEGTSKGGVNIYYISVHYMAAVAA